MVPEAINWYDVYPVFCLVTAGAGGEGDASGKRPFQSITQVTDWSELAVGDSFSNLDLDGHDSAVGAFEDEVYFVVVLVAPGPCNGGQVKPGCLPDRLLHDEGLEDVAELSQSRRVPAFEFVCAQTQEVCSDARVDDMHLWGL